MEAKGTIHQVKQEESGEGKNGTWYKRMIVVKDESSRFPTFYPIQLWGDLVKDKTYIEGAEISIEYDVSGREYNGKWYVDLKGWRINKNGSQQNTNQQQMHQQQPTMTHEQIAEQYKTEPAASQIDDDLPF